MKKSFAIIVMTIAMSLASALNVAAQSDYDGVTGSGSDIVLESADTKPQFPGGVEGLSAFIAEHLEYPADAYESRQQGTVVVRFVVNNTGKISDVRLVRRVSPSLNAEAIRVVQSLPDFIPARLNGKPVSVYYHLPIRFAL